MEISYILFCLFGGLVYLDTDAVGQFMISQPLAACTAAGVIFGNWPLGLTIGFLLQLPFLVEIPVGGAKVALGSLGSYAAAGVAVSSAAIFEPLNEFLIIAYSLAFGVALSVAAIPLQDGLRRLNGRLQKQADAAAEDGRLRRITQLQYLGAGLAFLFGVAVCAIFLPLGKLGYGSLIAITAVSSYKNDLIRPLFLGAGAGAVIWIFVKRQTIRYSMLGAGLAALVILINYMS